MITSCIHIRGLRVYAYHGVGSQEACVGNMFEVDVDLEMPCPKAVKTDCLIDTVSYAEVVDLIKEQMAVRSELIEHAAGRIHRAITFRCPLVERGSISIWKLCPPISAELAKVGFTLSW